MLPDVTPVLLTYNEAPNIGYTLACLSWAEHIVVVDSGSTDGTLQILRQHRNVRVFGRRFDSHHAQWRFATEETGIVTAWILRLDADYIVPPALVAEIGAIDSAAPFDAYRAAFDYAIYGRKLSASLYPPKPVLVRRGKFVVRDAGHTEAWDVLGPVGELKARVIHDDWKPMSDWIGAQARYMRRELDGPAAPRRRLSVWLRRHPPLMPIAAFVYALFAKRLVFDGRAGMTYALQRTVAEAIYALLYLERRLRPQRSAPAASPELPAGAGSGAEGRDPSEPLT
jgi:glycosyltransferase involved in cell wall biosynthesis